MQLVTYKSTSKYKLLFPSQSQDEFQIPHALVKSLNTLHTAPHRTNTFLHSISKVGYGQSRCQPALESACWLEETG